MKIFKFDPAWLGVGLTLFVVFVIIPLFIAYFVWAGLIGLRGDEMPVCPQTWLGACRAK